MINKLQSRRFKKKTFLKFRGTLDIEVNQFVINKQTISR